MIGGASAMVFSNSIFAVDSPDDIRCDFDDDFNVECDTSVNKTFLFAGMGLTAIGAWLFLKGERIKNLPEIVPTPRGVSVKQRIHF